MTQPTNNIHQSVAVDGKRMITLSPFYHSAVNAVTEPNRLVFCSRYLIERWSPLLGGTGLQILLYLRSHCFHDRRTGECRNHWQVSRSVLAQAIGVSEATVKRELAQNAALQLFVQPQQEYRLDGGRGGMRRDANSYRIAMDDPIHEADWTRVAAYVREAEARREKGGGAANEAEEAKRRARGHDNPTAISLTPEPDSPEPGDANLAPGQIDPAQDSGSLRVNLTQGWGQIDPTESKKETLKTPNVLTFNVRKAVNCVDVGNAAVHGSGERKAAERRFPPHPLDELVSALVAELDDIGSERRHRQLLSICEQHKLMELPHQALIATRRRLAVAPAQGQVDRPGAYYQRVLVALLEAHQVFVSTVAERAEDDPDEVRRLVRESLGVDA